MTENKRIVGQYMTSFERGDLAGILACLTDDVEWDIPGAFHVFGRDAFASQINDDAFVGRPAITTSRLTEEDDVVVAEGTVRTERKAGGFLHLRFCDVFEMREGRIRRLISYLAETTVV
jgi:uncharacterized protein